MAGSTRHYRVFAHNSVGTSAASNVDNATTDAATAPDLVVAPPTVSDSAPDAGATFTLNATVRNDGEGSSIATTLHYYRSTDSTITTGDTEVGTDSVGGLSAAGSGYESISLPAPDTPGTYYYGACVDSVSGESDTTNNCSSAVVVTVGSENTYGVGDFLPGVPTTGLFIPAVTVGASLSSSGGNTTIAFTNGGYIELQDGTRYTCQSTGGCGVHNGEVTQGTIVSESTSVSTSDLIVDPPTVSQSAPAAGTSFTLNATVRNQGNGSSSSTTLRYYRSTDATITTSDTSVGTDSVSGLNATGSSPESISLSAPSTAGTYYYGACVDSVTSESDTTDNCSVAVTVIVGTAPAPDLVVDMPTVSDSSPTAGASFTLTTTVRNQGNGSSTLTTLRYYRSTDSTITSSDTSVGTDSVSGLNSSGSGDESISLTAPSTSGTYYYGACVDSVTEESDTTNNCSGSVQVAVTAPTTAPDLAFRHFSAEGPTTGRNPKVAGASFHLYAQVHNIGTETSTTTTLRYYRSADSTITASDTEVGTDSVIALQSGRGLLHVSNTSVTAPDTPDIYYYGACVESVSGESDTTNNCSTAVEITVLAPPDIVVDTPEVGGQIGKSPVTLRHGQSFDLYARVRNQGNDVVYLTTVHYYLSTDATITTSDTVVGTKKLAGGPPTRISLTAPETSGTYYYGACADSIPLESDTSNNCSDSLLVIVEPPPAPDLVVDTPTVSYVYVSSLTAGDAFTLSFTVRNQGNRSSGPITLRYYRSNDAEFDDDDTLIASATESQVYYGGERNLTSERIIAHVFFAPSGDGRFEHRYISDGTYYYIVCVDPVSGESDTTNNCSGGVAVKATEFTTSSTCIVGYVLTPSDECHHRVQGKFGVIYGEVDAFNSGLGFIYHDFGRIETITRSGSGSGPGNRQTTVHVTNWAGENYLVTTVLTSAGNERIIELRFWED